MGMYDEINFKCACPVCGHSVIGFQSKDADCTLDTLEPDEVGNFYASCKECKTWIEFSRRRSAHQRRAEPLTEEQVIALGFVKSYEAPKKASMDSERQPK